MTSSRARRETSSPVMMRVRKAQVRRAARHFSLAFRDELCPSYRHRRITVLLAILLALAGEDEEAFEGEEEDDVV